MSHLDGIDRCSLQIIEVVNKTLAFHTSVNYEKLAPAPFTLDVHEDLLADLARISSQKYASDFDLHIDLSRTLKRLNDGHCVYINYCYDCEYYLPDCAPFVVPTYSCSSLYIIPSHSFGTSHRQVRYSDSAHRS